MNDARFDVLTMGRIGVDIYPLQSGVGLEDVETFGKYLGGTATNVAVAAARHGWRSAVISRVGDDPFGRYVHRALREFGVDDRYVWAVAVPGYDLYYLNVMAGPSPERAWRICDDPAHAWIRDTWAGQSPDPRLPLTTAAEAPGAGEGSGR